VQVIDVDQVLEMGQPQLHHRQQAVAAGHQPGGRTEPGQQPDGVVHTGRAFIVKRGRDLHRHRPRPRTRTLGAGTSALVNALLSTLLIYALRTYRRILQ
jgi:hypothetical protein